MQQEDEDDLLGEGREQASQEEGPGDPDALRGSRGAQYGGESELLYSQFELHSPATKKNQIELLEVSRSTFTMVVDKLNRLGR